MNKTAICHLLDIQHPVIQAPMNWITGVELASAVSNCGALGTLGPNAGYRIATKDVAETGRRLREQIRNLKKLTTRPFAVNFSARSGSEFKDSIAYSDECVSVAIEEGISVAITSGTDPKMYTSRFKSAGIKVLHRPIPCTVQDALEAEDSGVDCVIAVGYESGGHSGLQRIPTMVLVPQIADALKIPVIAGGGIADARGLLAALALGAEGVFIGTAFITTDECPAHPNFKQAIISASDTDTVTWITLNGSLRALRNQLSEKCVDMEARGASVNELTAMARSAYYQGIVEGDVLNGNLVCGAAAGIIKQITSTENYIKTVVQEAEQISLKLR